MPALSWKRNSRSRTLGPAPSHASTQARSSFSRKPRGPSGTSLRRTGGCLLTWEEHIGRADSPTRASAEEAMYEPCESDRTRTPLLLPPGITRVVVILVHPTQYDDDGFPFRFLRGVMPSNSL